MSRVHLSATQKQKSNNPKMGNFLSGENPPPSGVYVHFCLLLKQIFIWIGFSRFIEKN
jgi:hypothetical protein